MAETPETNVPAVPEIQARLHDLMRILRRSSTLDPESHHALVDLVGELGRALEKQALPAAEVTHLAESTAHLAESIHQHQDRGILGKARDRFEVTLVNAESHAPAAVSLARRLLDALANIGI